MANLSPAQEKVVNFLEDNEGTYLFISRGVKAFACITGSHIHPTPNINLNTAYALVDKKVLIKISGDWRGDEYKLSEKTIMEKDNQLEKWFWMMGYCKKEGIPAAQSWAWRRAEVAYNVTVKRPED